MNFIKKIFNPKLKKAIKNVEKDTQRAKKKDNKIKINEPEGVASVDDWNGDWDTWEPNCYRDGGF